jgi:hypothetical protein
MNTQTDDEAMAWVTKLESASESGGLSEIELRGFDRWLAQGENAVAFLDATLFVLGTQQILRGGDPRWSLIETRSPPQ